MRELRLLSTTADSGLLEVLEAKGLTFGVKVKVTGAGNLDGIWTVQDRMNKRWSHRIDFLVNQDMKGGKWENVRVEIINDDNRL